MINSVVVTDAILLHLVPGGNDRTVVMNTRESTMLGEGTCAIEHVRCDPLKEVGTVLTNLLVSV